MWKTFLAIALAWWLAPAVAPAQQPTVPFSRLGVDRVRLASGETLYGFILSIETDQTMVLAIERSWLSKTYPQLSERYTASETAMVETARQELLARAQTWFDERGREPSVLKGLLQSELDRLRNPSEPNMNKQFIRIVLLPAEVSEKTQQAPQRRQLAGLAWQHNLADPTVTPVVRLAQQLTELGVDTAAEKVDLSDAIVAGPLNEKQWAVRRALIEYRYYEAIDYQGAGSTLIRQSDEVDIGALLTSVLGGAVGNGGLINQLGAELGLPEFRPPPERDDWYGQVTRAVESDGFRGVRITRLSQSLLSSQVHVDTHFFAMEQPGKWFEVVKFSATADANSVGVDRIDKLKADPQIKQVLDTLSGLGLPIDAARIEQALRHGAATQIATDKTNEQFQEFLNLTKEKLDAPVPAGL